MPHPSTSLHVGILIDEWRPIRGGAEVAVAGFARYLAGRGHVVRVLAHEADAGAPGIFQAVRRDRSPLALLSGPGACARRNGARLVAAARAARCEVTLGIRHLPEVDLYWPHGGAHAVSVAAQRAARTWRPGQVSERDREVQLRGRQRAWVELERDLLAGGRARAVACVSTLVRDELARRYPEASERLVVVPNGVDTSHFTCEARVGARAGLVADLQLDPAVPILTFVARNATLKGLPVLLHALVEIVDEPWVLLVAGGGSPALRAHEARLARRLALSKARIRPLGWYDARVLAAGADLHVAPTWRDTSGLTILEALACGTPVLTTARAGAAEYVRDSECGVVLARPGDVALLAGALRTELARVRATVDRARVRSAVEALDSGACHARLEQLLGSLARTGSSS